MNEYEKGTFGYDLHYLAKTDSPIVLTSNDNKAQIIVSAKYQAKVFTSTAEGPEGKSLGFLNYKVFESDEINLHMNGYGGENRLWIGPEGGRFSVFFKPGVEQVYDNWFTPPPVDTEPWIVVDRQKKSVSMEKEMEVANYIGSRLHLKVNRKVQLLEASDIQAALGVTPGEKVKTVAYTTENSLMNLNDFAWTRETGTVCIWILDMFNTAPDALTFVPYNVGDERELGVIATSNYFGEIPADRYQQRDNGLVFLKTDGKYRSKIGLNVKRTKSIAANYDPQSKHLTIATFDVDPNAVYLNQEWNPEKDPMTGDVLNAYNDGPLEDGSIMGPFLELESDSPAALLAPNETLYHQHNVFHFAGEDADLSAITQSLFGITIQELKSIF
ncbi:hypothetical protein AGMMS49574_21410 [Bacteroidia bacterium]|nr:hypothetical protein AGMMS49574_21410 [Bacteroidia bacterium]